MKLASRRELSRLDVEVANVELGVVDLIIDTEPSPYLAIQDIDDFFVVTRSEIFELSHSVFDGLVSYFYALEVLICHGFFLENKGDLLFCEKLVTLVK